MNSSHLKSSKLLLVRHYTSLKADEHLLTPHYVRKMLLQVGDLAYRQVSELA